MADPTLHGNGDRCPACALRRASRSPWDSARVVCNACGGTGRQARSDAEIVAAHVDWARAHYWPEREARWARA